MPVTFSIIIPVYNVERYIQECFDSIACQVEPDDEIILVNDGSTDSSQKICLEIKEKNSQFVRFIDQSNKGLSAARNIGLRNAEKDYVLFVDSDDKVKNDYLSTLRSNLSKKHEIDVLMFGYETFPNGAVYTPGFSEGIKRTQSELMQDNKHINSNNDFSFSWRFAIRRSFINKYCLTFDEEARFGEDYLFNANILLIGGVVCVIKKSLYMYRIDNPESIMRTRFKPNLEEQIAYQYQKKLEIVERYNLHSFEGWDHDFAWYYITAFRDMLIRNLYNSDNSNKIASLKRILSLPLITDNYKIVGTEYWKYSKRAALLHFCCKHRLLLYIDYKARHYSIRNK